MRDRSFVLLAVLVALTGAVIWAGEAPSVALQGYCPVSYVAMDKAVQGKEAYASEHQGRTYHFANGKGKAMFDEAPDKFLPAYDGYCATAVAQGKKLVSDPTLFRVVDGRTYLFSSAKALKMFDKDPGGTIAKADGRWPELERAAE